MRLALALMVSSERSRMTLASRPASPGTKRPQSKQSAPLELYDEQSRGNANKLDFISVSACWAMQESPPSTPRMLAYIVVGIIMGWLAWQLKHGNGKEMAKLPALILFGIVSAVVGGVGMNLLIFNENIFAVEAWSWLPPPSSRWWSWGPFKLVWGASGSWAESMPDQFI